MVAEGKEDPAIRLGVGVAAQTGPPSSPLCLGPCLAQEVAPGVVQNPPYLPLVGTGLRPRAQGVDHKTHSHRDKDHLSSHAHDLEKEAGTYDDL